METPLEARIAAGESADFELKTTLADSRKIIETIAAMATLGGGTILIGVKQDGTLAGANIGEGERERLVQQVLASTDPRLYVELDEPVLAGKRLLRIRVPPGDGPHLAFGRAFHRVGPATVAMTRDEYERRLLDRLRESSGFERRYVQGLGLADLELEEVRRWCRLAAARLPSLDSKSSPQQVLSRLHLGQGEQVTVAGALMFAKEPQGPLPQAVIRAHARRGAAEDAQVFEGPVARQIDAALDFVMRNLRVRTRVQGARREEQPELPTLAVREVIANAVAHRDYRSTAATQLRLTDSGLEVWNAGHFPPPITSALLRTHHPSVPPNPLLARALFLAGYIEEWGTGTLRTIEAMRSAHNPEPTFTASAETGVLVRLPLAGKAAIPDTRAGTTLRKFSRDKKFSSAEFAARARVSIRTAAFDLKQLEEQGLVRRVGVGRATRWIRT
jgi:ATP-dependent DNA helicase RecG